MPTIDDYSMKIHMRFVTDLERMATDFAESVIQAQAYDYDDFTIVEKLVDTEMDYTQRRMDMAADSAGWQGFELGRVEVMDQKNLRFLWMLDAAAEHCATCLAYAAQSAREPFTLETLPGIPGDANTICDGG